MERQSCHRFVQPLRCHAVYAHGLRGVDLRVRFHDCCRAQMAQSPRRFAPRLHRVLHCGNGEPLHRGRNRGGHVLSDRPQIGRLDAQIRPRRFLDFSRMADQPRRKQELYRREHPWLVRTSSAKQDKWPRAHVKWNGKFTTMITIPSFCCVCSQG